MPTTRVTSARYIGRLLSFVHRGEARGPAPHPVDVLQYALRAGDVEPAAVARMVVRERQAAVVLELHRRHARRAEVELRREDRLANGVDVLGGDTDLVARAGFVDEQARLARELLVEPVADEAEVVLVPAHLARALDAVLLDDPFPDGKAQV